MQHWLCLVFYLTPRSSLCRSVTSSLAVITTSDECMQVTNQNTTKSCFHPTACQKKDEQITAKTVQGYNEGYMQETNVTHLTYALSYWWTRSGTEYNNVHLISDKLPLHEWLLPTVHKYIYN